MTVPSGTPIPPNLFFCFPGSSDPQTFLFSGFYCCFSPLSVEISIL